MTEILSHSSGNDTHSGRAKLGLLITSPRPPPPNTIILVIKISICGLERDRNGRTTAEMVIIENTNRDDEVLEQQMDLISLASCRTLDMVAKVLYYEIEPGQVPLAPGKSRQYHDLHCVLACWLFMAQLQDGLDLWTVILKIKRVLLTYLCGPQTGSPSTWLNWFQVPASWS